MATVLGLGGLFFKSPDPAATAAWYSRVLGIVFESWGGTVFRPADAAEIPGAGTVFCPFSADTGYFAPATTDYMFNLIVDDLDGVLAHCANHGVAPLAAILDEPNGRFAHIMDCDGRKIELWQPKPMA